ncbi:uncharacterized protein ACBR49_005125 [Aulostomus maculatus]
MRSVGREDSGDTTGHRPPPLSSHPQISATPRRERGAAGAARGAPPSGPSKARCPSEEDQETKEKAGERPDSSASLTDVSAAPEHTATRGRLRMAGRDERVVWSFVVLLAGSVGQRVIYDKQICAVKGSTVTIGCSFTPIKEVVRVVWCVNHEICQGSTPSVFDSNATKNVSRYKYLGDKKGNCTLQISDVQKEDNRTFRFRMEARSKDGHFTERSGARVQVTDVPQIVIDSPGRSEVRNGGRVTLTCTNNCMFHQLDINWFKDGIALAETSPSLQLSRLTTKDSGIYTCGLKTSKVLSRPFSLHLDADKVKDDLLALVVGSVVGILLALATLTLAIFIIKRKRAAVAESVMDPRVSPSWVELDYSASGKTNSIRNQMNPLMSRLPVEVRAKGQSAIFPSLLFTAC